jgi:putative membrane protein
MRWFYLSVIVLLCAAIVLFAAQNMQMTTTSLLGLSIQMPLAFLVIVVYLIGMATGGSVWAFLRWSLEGSRRTSAVRP